MGEMLKHGWVMLADDVEVHLDHGVPTAVCVKGGGLSEAAALARQVMEFTGLKVALGPWRPGERIAEQEAAVVVAREDLAEVVRRLATASARVFVDYYHKPVDEEDPDWDPEEFAQDFGNALKYCGLKWGEVDQDAYFRIYRDVMHAETARLVRAG
ncbi:MAG: hypothetical protein HYU77_11200 [Betaproteobacteria bacterium]|nr:hypothetical protein [Betaproteobacteria bacterium]